MPELRCPVCGGLLQQREKTYVCSTGHSFDRAKSGYVNLLIARQSAAQHGDDKKMVRARRAFLEGGFYEPLQNALCRAAMKQAPEKRVDLLDAGCGECYYTAAVEQALLGSGREVSAVGVDISKDALRFGDKRGHDLRLAVASAYHMPVEDDSCDIVLNVFAPFAGEEYLRVLRRGGVVLHVSPGEHHLWELKQVLYDHPYPNEVKETPYEGFAYAEIRHVEDRIRVLGQEDIHALFQMTPYYWKTPKSGCQRLAALEELAVTISFDIHVFRREA